MHYIKRPLFTVYLLKSKPCVDTDSANVNANLKCSIKSLPLAVEREREKWRNCYERNELKFFFFEKLNEKTLKALPHLLLSEYPFVIFTHNITPMTDKFLIICWRFVCKFEELK